MIRITPEAYENNLEWVLDNFSFPESSERLKKYQGSLCIQSKALANMLGVSESDVAAWRKGKYKPSAENYKKIAYIFNMDVDILLGPPIEKITSPAYNAGLKAIIKMNKINLTAFSNHIGVVDPRTMHSWILKDILPSPQYMEKISEYLGVDSFDIYELGKACIKAKIA